MKRLFVPISLFLLWFGLSVQLLITDAMPSLTTLVSSHVRKDFTQFQEDELHKGDVVSAGFLATENNLGALSVRFSTFLRLNYDYLVFRIRERGQEKWYYQNSYKVDQFQPEALFPFGFPVIADSSGRYYEFELESTAGELGDSVGISPQTPIFVTWHKFDKTEIFSSKEKLLTFVIKKIVNVYSDTSFAASSLVYSSPLILYAISQLTLVIWSKIRWLPDRLVFKKYPFHSMIRHTVEQFSISHKYPMVTYYFFILLMFTIANKQKNGYAEAILLTLWIVLLRFYHLQSRASFTMALIFLSLCPIFFLIKLLSPAENAALWTYVFMVSGTIQGITELRSSKK